MRQVLRREGSSSAYLGRTFAVGFFGGMLVPMGQSLVCLALWLVIDRLMKLRFNPVLACLLTLISNPLTTPFWFYLFYLTGTAMLGSSALGFDEFSVRLAPLLKNLDNIDSIWESVVLLMKGIGLPILLGSVPWHFMMAFVGYFVGAWLFWRIRKRFEKKLALRKLRGKRKPGRRFMRRLLAPMKKLKGKA